VSEKIGREDSLIAVLESIAKRSRAIVLLDVFAHGKVVPSGYFSTVKGGGGYGAYMGAENIKLANASIWSVLKDKFHKDGIINMQVCKFADQSGPRRGPARRRCLRMTAC
jgi:hypothetical protein